MSTLTSDSPLATAASAGTAGTATTAAGNASTPAKAEKRPYLHQVDLIRAVTFALVIFVHSLTQTTAEMTSVPVNATSLLFHSTRNIFFALTGFILMYQYQDRPDFRATNFWRRRMKLVIMPYVVWSAVYWVITGMWAYGRLRDVPTSLDEFWNQLKWGTAGFQLYFLLVMLQVYLLFPAIRWIVQKTRGRHALLLSVSLALQIAAFAIITCWTPPSSWAPYWWHHYATFIPYQFFIFCGAVAASNRKRIDAWLRGKGLVLGAFLIGAAALAVGVYLLGVQMHGDVHSSDAAFELYLLPFLVVSVTAMYAMGRYWAESVRPYSPQFGKVVAYASNRSFPVFLVHVLVLFFLLRPTSDDGRPVILHVLHQPWGTAATYVLTIAISLAAAEILRRMPFASYLTGRPRLPFRWQI
ncbi:MAG: acyltransferase [Gordonia sp. (in: high G+C Gram-positive bacteria)]